MSENDAAWQRFFAQTDTLREIERSGYCYVLAQNLKQYGEREPRLMAKIDTLAERPQSFRKHGLSLFPVRNGQYVIFPDEEERTYYRFRDRIDTLPIQEFITNADLFAYDAFPGTQALNESQAIDFAFIAGLLQHYTQDMHIRLAIRGRSFTRQFDFTLPDNNQKIEVDKVQIEVDAGYESPTAIYLIEAKIGKRDDFNIRQLYYPYLEWSRRSRKRIVPIFLVYTNGKYYLTEFKFAQNFGEMNVVRSECFVINERSRPLLRLGNLLEGLPPTFQLREPNVPYPQADDLDKVLDVVAKVKSGISTRHEIAEAFEFDERQGDYYANAAAYLGLLERSAHGFVPTDIGEKYLQTSSRALRYEIIVRQLLLRPSYRNLFKRLQLADFELDRMSIPEIAAIIEANTDLSGSTPRRRAQSVRSWLANLLRNAEFQS